MDRPADLRSFIDITRRTVDEALERFLPSAPACPPIVGEAMRYSIFAGGKRLRPVLVLAAADAVARAARAGSGSDTARGFSRPTASEARALALPVACAIEMIHTYSLIHDDLPAMDNDTLRRGRPTLHTVYGDGIAILVGDGLHAEAFTLLAKAPAVDDPLIVARKMRAIAVVGEAAGAAGMVGGQTIDLQAAGQAPGYTITLDAEGLRQMHARKTGALIRASAVSGAIMAGADERTIAAVDRYAADLGLAFQIVDDILDIESTTAQLGKTTGKDAVGAKPTYPALFGLERSRVVAGECIARAHVAVDEAGLSDGWLDAIADWVISRKS